MARKRFEKNLPVTQAGQYEQHPRANFPNVPSSSNDSLPPYIAYPVTIQQSSPYGAPNAPPPPYQTPNVIYIPNAYDSSARFNQGAAPVIPPPPPGCITAHPAQIAQAQGQQVILGKQKADFFYQHGGGSTMW